MTHARFELADARHVHLGALTDGSGRRAWHLAGFSQRFGGCELHLEPFMELVLLAPDAAHLLARVPWDQTLFLSGRLAPRSNARCRAHSQALACELSCQMAGKFPTQSYLKSRASWEGNARTPALIPLAHLDENLLRDPSPWSG